MENKQFDFSGRDLLKVLDFSEDELQYMIGTAQAFKDMKKRGVNHRFFKGKNIAILFEKDSTRTRCAFEVAGYDLGLGVTYLGPTGSQMGKKESIADTARVLSRMYEGIEFRGFSHETVEELAKYASVPVWNGLTDTFHPTQMLADFLTIKEHFGRFQGLTLMFAGDTRNNSGNSLMAMCSKMGVNFIACGPKSLWPEEKLIETCRPIAEKNGCKLEFTEDPERAKDADIIYADVWLSMGEPEEKWAERVKLLQPYQVNREMMEKAGKDAIFLHCLPSLHDQNTEVGQKIFEKFGLKEMEVTNEVFESEQSLVFDEAENRLHTIKAVIYLTLKEGKGENEK